MVAENTFDYLQKSTAIKEMLVGVKAAKQLQGAIRAAIGAETVKHTGRMMRSTAKAIAEEGYGKLDRITIASPHYSFKLNYGFEGVKSNGVAMSLTPKQHLHTAIESSNILNTLATELGEINADAYVASINF